MGTTPGGIDFPEQLSAFDPAGDMATLASDSDVGRIITVANVTHRNALAAALAPSADNPVYVHRTDAAAGQNLEVTTDGITWKPVQPAVQRGTTLCTPTAANTIIGVTVTFPVPFATTPTVLSTVSTTANAQAFAYVAGVTTTGFQILFRRDTVVATNVNWIAIA